MRLNRLALFITLPLLSACSSDPRFAPEKTAKTAQPPTTRFELLPPERSGIRFVPNIREEYRYNFIADPYIYNGGGVAVLDVNNDGLQDLFFTARLQGCRLYLNKGGLQFEDISESSGVAAFSGLKTGVTVVDINNDGRQDLYVCRTWLTALPERRNLLLVNQGNNTFTESAAAYGLDDLSASQHANFFDCDQDGDMDCYVVNHPVDFKNINNLDYTAGPARAQPPKDEYESDRLYRNDGSRFTDVTAQAGLRNRAFGLSTLAADVNHDGRTDLFVGNDFVMPDFLYINLGNGRFEDQADAWFRHTSNHTMGADLADLNRDGLADLVSLDMLAEAWPRRRQLMSTMSLERDRQMRERGFGRQVMRNTLQMANGNGSFSEIGCLAGMYATDWSWAPLLADYDNDGWCDLFISSGIKRDLNDLDFFLYTADSINRSGGVNKSRFADFEQYVGLMPSVPSHNYLFQNTGSLQLTDVSEAWGFTQRGFSNGAAYADLDNDGDLDLITNNLESPPSVYENKAVGLNAHHWLQIKCAGPPQNPSGLGATVRVYAGGKRLFTGEMTNVRGFYSSVEPIFQIGLGSLTQVDKVEIDWPGNRHQIMQNLPANQRITLQWRDAQPGLCPEAPREATLFADITATSGLDFRHQENPFEDFDRQKLLPYRLSRTGPRMAQADLNADGLEDLFVCGASGQSGALYLQRPDGNFTHQLQPALLADQAIEDTDAAFLDADADGDQDLYVVSGGDEPLSYQDRLYLNDGKGNFSQSPQPLPAADHSGSCVAVLDYDADGKPDVVLGGRAVPGKFPEPVGFRVLHNEGGGSFRDVTAEVMPEVQRLGMITDLQVADLNADAKPELIAVGDWMPVSILRFDGKKWHLDSSDNGLADTQGWWRSVLTSNLDGDRDVDILAGNVGLNTRFRATPGAPLRLFASDLDQNGSLDPLLCTPWEGAYYPVASRDQLAAQMPLIKKNYPRYTPYATKPVNQLFSEKSLLAHTVLDTRTLETRWFENRNGKFIARSLPVEAQMAPVYALLHADLTGDGLADLFLAGNDTGFEPETYGVDASNGCLLKGDGKGAYEWVANLESGIWAVQEARDVAWLREASGKNVLILANNHGQMRVFSAR
ncbi:MAG: VCBS repeat-containing protein [Saprospiraceae bacterium]|nr:VCBS repeat-containing protein [Saprospiraceae bacterium]